MAVFYTHATNHATAIHYSRPDPILGLGLGGDATKIRDGQKTIGNSDGAIDMPYAFIIEETSSKFFRLQIQSLVTKHVMVDQKESLVAAKGRARLKHNLPG